MNERQMHSKDFKGCYAVISIVLLPICISLFGAMFLGRFEALEGSGGDISDPITGQHVTRPD